MMPAFGAPAMRKLWPLMLDKVNLMRRKIEVGAEPDGSFVLASDKWMGLLTVEVIHKCGFGDEPGCLETERPSVLESVVRQMYSVPRGWIDILEEADLIPFLNVSLGILSRTTLIVQLSRRQRAFRRRRVQSNVESEARITYPPLSYADSAETAECKEGRGPAGCIG